MGRRNLGFLLGATFKSKKSVIINSLNNGLPFYFIGEFTEGTHYFFTNDGRIVPASDPDITTWYAGVGNADGDIDEDIKQLRIYDVDSPVNVQLDVAFNVSGLYVLLAGRIVIEGWNGTAWVKIHPGDYITCLNGDFDETVTIATADGFSVNSVVTIRVRDYETYGLNGSDTSNIISTVTLNAISDVTATVAKTIGGTTNGASVNIYYKLHSAGIWTLAGAGTVDTGADTWTYSLTIATAGTYDIKVTDGTDADGFALQENVVVASGELIIDDFESYSNGQSLNDTYWTRVSGANMQALSVAKYSGNLGGGVNGGGGDWSAIHEKTIPSQNITGKTVTAKFRHVVGYPDNFFTLSLYQGAVVRAQVIVTGSSSESWQNISATYSGTIDKIRIEMRERYGNYIYFDNIKIV